MLMLHASEFLSKSKIKRKRKRQVEDVKAEERDGGWELILESMSWSVRHVLFLVTLANIPWFLTF